MAIVIIFALVKRFSVSRMRDFFLCVFDHTVGGGAISLHLKKRHSWSINIDSHGKGLNITYPTIGLNSGLYDEEEKKLLARLKRKPGTIKN